MRAYNSLSPTLRDLILGLIDETVVYLLLEIVQPVVKVISEYYSILYKCICIYHIIRS